MAREAIPTWFFAMAIVRLGRRFLLVRERKHGQLWYFPAGRAAPGESFAQAAERETLEESGVPIVVEGVLRVDHTPSPTGARVRVFVVGRPKDDSPPKQIPDEHSLEARWVTLEELSSLPLRGDEVREVLEYVNKGCAIYPLSLIVPEGSDWGAPCRE